MLKILCIPCFVISAGYVRCNLLTLKCQYDTEQTWQICFVWYFLQIGKYNKYRKRC